MTFTLEDGTGIAGANAYIDAAYYTAHHEDRGRTVSDGATAIQGAIVRATDHVDKVFGPRFRGTRQSLEQGRDWPRYGAVMDSGLVVTGLPDKLKMAVAEYARLAIRVGVLAPSPPTMTQSEDLAGVRGSEAKGAVRRIKDPSGGEKEWFDAGMQPGLRVTAIPSHPEADLWMQELIETGARRLVRS